jgi:hypothetical protein
LQPSVKLSDPRIESGELMLVGQQLDRPQGLDRHVAGIGLRSFAYRRTVAISSTGASRATTNRWNASTLTSMRCAPRQHLLGASRPRGQHEPCEGFTREISSRF